MTLVDKNYDIDCEVLFLINKVIVTKYNKTIMEGELRISNGLYYFNQINKK